MKKIMNTVGLHIVHGHNWDLLIHTRGDFRGIEISWGF